MRRAIQYRQPRHNDTILIAARKSSEYTVLSRGVSLWGGVRFLRQTFLRFCRYFLVLKRLPAVGVESGFETLGGKHAVSMT